MNLMQRRRALMAQAATPGGGGHGLPAEYQEVEYARATGTQYLVLSGIIASSEITKYKIDISASVNPGNSSTAIMCGIGSSTGCWLGVVNGGQNVGIGASIYFAGLSITDKHYYSLDYTQGTIAVATCDGGSAISRQLSTVGGRLALFAGVAFNGDASYKSKCDIYSAYVYYDGTKSMELYPCYRKSDGEIGMYDKINDAFHTNAGTGTFEKGPNV